MIIDKNTPQTIKKLYMRLWCVIYNKKHTR